jgi:competence ComEA-like helix-hairpin-helix protein
MPGLMWAAGLLALGVVAAVILRLERNSLHTPDVVDRASEAFWPDMRIDLNRATVAELQVLPSIGPGMALRIVTDRDERGPFDSVEDLGRVPGIGDRTIEAIGPYVVVTPRGD